MPRKLEGNKRFWVLTAQSLVKHTYLSSMFTTLEAKLTLVSVADSIVSANRLKFRRTGWTLANRRPTDFRANRAPLADLRQNSNFEFSHFPLSPSLFRSKEKREINRAVAFSPFFFLFPPLGDSGPFVVSFLRLARKPDNLSAAIFYRLARHFNSRDSTSRCSGRSADFLPYSSPPRPGNRIKKPTSRENESMYYVNSSF